MRKYANALIGTIGFFFAAGAAGGIECDTMSWSSGLLCIALGLAVMASCALLGRRAR